MRPCSFSQRPVPSWLFLLPVLAALSGCQSMLRQTQPVPTPPAAATPEHVFALTGKIGVSTPGQSGSAFFAWSQQDERFAIELTGALGLGQTRIEGVPGRYTLRSSRSGTVTAASPEFLLEQATGWQAPISQLRHWIMGQPAHPSSAVQRDAQQRLTAVTEQGWSARFDYADDQARLPSRLVMTQPLPAGQRRVVVSIQSRQP